MFDVNDFVDEDGDGQPDPSTDQDDETDGLRCYPYLAQYAVNMADGHL